MKEYLAVAIIDCYNEITEQTEKDNMILTNVDSYKEAMALLEEYYSDTVESVHITLFEGPFLKVSDRIVDEIMTGEIVNE